MKIAFIAPDVTPETGPGRVNVSLLERICEDHQVSLLSHTVKGIDLSRIKYYRLPAIKRKNVWGSISFIVSSTIIFTVLSLLRKKDFDIIHSADYSCSFYADVITSHFCEREGIYLEKASIINISHKGALQKLKALDHRIYREFRAFLERVTFGRNSSKVRIAVSQRMKEQFVRHYGEAAKGILVIHNAADLKIFTPANQPLYRDRIRQKHGISHNDLVLIFAGGDWERKGVRYLIEALSLLASTDVKLLIVGSGDEKFYGQLAEQKQVRERIIFVPHSSILYQYYAASDIFVFPTIYEPFGLTIVEAMASGLPVITSRSAGAAELITDGTDGLLLNEPSDINDLATKIDSLLSNAELRKTMGERARETAEKFSWERVTEKTLKVYNSVLKRKRRQQKNSHGSGLTQEYMEAYK